MFLHATAVLLLPMLQAAADQPLRQADARVEAIADRIARAATPWCTQRAPLPGWALHHLAEYPPALRTDLIAVYGLDRGPGIVATAPGGAAATAGLLPGDTIVALNGTPVTIGAVPARESREPGNRIEALIEATLATGPAKLGILRNGELRDIILSAPGTCPTRIRIARAESENAFADGSYATFSAKLVERIGSDDELAAAIAHELAHNYLGHGARRRNGTDRRPVRAQEEEADRFALRLMAAAGYDPRAALALFDRVVGWNPLDALGLGTHVVRSRRLSTIRDELTRMEATPDQLRWDNITVAWRRAAR